MKTRVGRIASELLLLFTAAAAAAPLAAQQQRLLVKPGGWVGTSITVNAGDRIVVMGAGGQISCAQCNPSTSGPRGVSGYYKLYAQVGQTPYDLSENREFVSREAGQLFLGIGNIQQNQAANWQGAYDVQVIRYPGTGAPNPPTPTPTPTTFPLIAWGGSDCANLGTEGILEGALQLPGGPQGVLCHIYVEDWDVRGDNLWVCLPGAIPGDNWGGHPSGVTVLWSGTQPVYQLSGHSSGFAEAQPKHPGHSVYPWTLNFGARPGATSATIPVDVYQGKACGQPTSQAVRINIPVVVRPKARGVAVNFASFFWTGYQMANAVVSSTNNWDPSLTRNALVAGQQWAGASSGFLVPQAWADLVNRLNQGGNAAVAGPIKQLHEQINSGLQRNCTCGNASTNTSYAYSLGYNVCLAEMATINGWDARTLQGYLTLLQQQAPRSGLLQSTDIDRALGYVAQGYDSRSLKDYIAGMRANISQAMNLTCTCM